jgi:hypothetical protein
MLRVFLHIDLAFLAMLGGNFMFLPPVFAFPFQMA